MITLPLTWNDQALGALVCERAALAFSQSETWALRLVADQLSRPLRDLERAQAPWWKRLGREFASWLPESLRPQTAEGKRFTQWAALALAVVLLVPFPYSIEAKFVMKTDAMAFVGAPFDGYIESSNVSLGLPVKAGQVLFAMSTKELLLERSAALADLSQIGREVERRRAANQLAEMRIAEAQYAQTQSKLEQTEFRLASASASAPIAGVVVEGEPGKNLGGAVKRGEMVVKVASVERLYAEFAVSESDVRLVKPQQSARIRMVAHPANTWDMTVTRTTPAPSVKEGGNTFPVRAEPAEDPPDWWRPGMSGTGRIDVGYRNLLWRATHRLVDYLRLRIWFI
jgi:multidrug efflux pump subunit AcrA (membrane-fusion protein)